jgi:hypothetical protein
MKINNLRIAKELRLLKACMRKKTYNNNDNFN